MQVTSLSFVIPALNEARVIAHTVQECFATAETMHIADVEVIVIDDGSTDDTGAIAQQVGARVVRHPRPGGYGRALKDGIRQAQHDTIVITDADGTYPIRELPRLMEEYAKGFDMIVGARQGEHYRQSSFKSGLRTLLRWLVEWASGQPVADINSGFRVFSRSKILPFFPHLCETFSFSTSMTLAYMMTGAFVAYVPISYHERVGRSHVRLFRDSVRTLTYILLQILYFNPIKIFSAFSALCLLMSLVGFGISNFFHLNIGYFIGIIGILSSIIVFSIGLLTEQIRQLTLRIEKKN